jgi:hypothetical protein
VRLAAGDDAFVATLFPRAVVHMRRADLEASSDKLSTTEGDFLLAVGGADAPRSWRWRSWAARPPTARGGE